MSIRRTTLEEIVHRCDRLAQQGQRLRPGQPPLAALDADGTLWGPDVADLLWQRLLTEKALDRRAAPLIARSLREAGVEPTRDAYQDFESLRRMREAGKVSAETMVRLMLRGLVGLREEALEGHALHVVSTAPQLSTLSDGESRGMIDKLRALGFRVIVVSGSPRWVVEAAVAAFGIPTCDVLAGQVSVVEGVLTDGIIEPLPWGKGKVQAILRRFGAVPRVSMGNGLGDLPMMEATSHLRVLVNPTDDLMVACEEIKGPTWSMDLLGLPAAKSGKKVPTQVMGQAAGQATPRRTRRPTAGS